MGLYESLNSFKFVHLLISEVDNPFSMTYEELF
jgi:hypothetical protein